MSIKDKKSYDERLFKGWQGFYHNRRFLWVQKELKSLKYSSVIEIGCFNCKVLDFIKKPKEYFGIDAGYERKTGIDVALKKYKSDSSVKLKVGSKPSDIPSKKYDVSISLETFEHINPSLVDDYLKKLSGVVTKRAYFSVPVERGIPFLIASSVRLINGTTKEFTFSEFVNSFLGRMKYVRRNHHKGFDDRVFVKQIRKHFKVIKVKSMFGPAWLKFRGWNSCCAQEMSGELYLIKLNSLPQSVI